MAIKVAASEIDADGGTVNIRSKKFVEALIKDRESAVAVLETAGASVDLSNVSVDENGDVVIADEEYAAALKEKLSNMGSTEGVLDNGACGAGC